MPTVNTVFGSGGIHASCPNFLASLECEIESVKNGGANIGFWKCIADGSLRNNGWEYTSSHGLDRKSLVNTFKELHKSLKLDKDPFTERTSTHVHVNVSSLETDAVKKLLLLYALYEEFFFTIVHPSRRDNIHCVPLTETYLPSEYSQKFDVLVGKWHKYTAFNMKRIVDLGTVEFRHMQGTDDADTIDTWLHVLENLWNLCQRIEINEKTLSDKKQLMDWFELLFFPAPKVMMLRPSMFNIIRNSLIDVKFSVKE